MREAELQREGVYVRKVTVTGSMTDADGIMSVLSIAKNMQEAAGDQLIDLGIGFDVTSGLNMLWVVVWSEFHFKRFPKTGESVTFYTWPGKKMHWFYPRRAYVFDANGEELAHGAYLWMLMDSETRKVTDDKGLLGVLPTLKIEGECKVPQMKTDFPENLPETCLRKVAPDEIDENGHVNNAHYLNWAMDVAKECGFGTAQLKTIWINYKKEILPDDTVELCYMKDGNLLCVAGSGMGEHHFIARLDFSA